jgi:hypothetical protein
LVVKTFFNGCKLSQENSLAKTTNSSSLQSSLIQKKYVVNIILKIKTEEERTSGGRIMSQESNNISFIGRRISDEVYFLICQSCFWCASYIGANTFTTRTAPPTTKCPICSRENLESMSIADNEGYRFDYNSKRGIILEFLK